MREPAGIHDYVRNLSRTWRGNAASSFGVSGARHLSAMGVSVMKLNGKVALITGAGSGIGHAIAKRYLEADGRVVIADLDAAAAAKAASELAGEKSAIGVRMDVSN